MCGGLFINLDLQQQEVGFKVLRCNLRRKLFLKIYACRIQRRIFQEISLICVSDLKEMSQITLVKLLKIKKYPHCSLSLQSSLPRPPSIIF